MDHFYRNVAKLGNVALSRHAQKRMEEDKISQDAFERALLTPIKQDIRDGSDILWRERDGIRIVILDRLAETFIAQAQAAYFRSGAGARNAFFQ